MSTTINMSLELPDVGVTIGPNWASDLNTALTSVDSHDHSSGKGKKITPSGININAVLTLNDNALTNIQESSYFNKSTDSTVINTVYIKSGELFFRDAASNNVKLTAGGTINVGSVGGIGGDYGTGSSSIDYLTASDKAYIFTNEDGTRALVDIGNLLAVQINTTADVGIGVVGTPTAALDILNTANNSLRIRDGSGTVFIVSVEGNVLAEGTLAVTGATTLASTLGVTGISTFTAAPVFSSTTASTVLGVDSGKGLVSLTSTGTGSVVKATSPTLVTPVLGTPSSGTLTNCTGLAISNTTGTLAVNRGGTGVTTKTGTGNVVLSAGSTLTGTTTMSKIVINQSGSDLIDIHQQANTTPISIKLRGTGSSNITHFGVETATGTGIFGTGAAFATVWGTSSAHNVYIYAHNNQVLQFNSNEQAIFSNKDGALTPAIAFDGAGTTGFGIISGTGALNFSIGAVPKIQFQTGDVAAKTGTAAWVALSDSRLKKDISDLDDGLDVILSLSSKYFNWINPEGHVTHLDTGFVAQEYETVLPNHVVEIDPICAKDQDILGKGKKAKAINGSLDAYIVKAIQQLSAKIDKLQGN